MLSLPCTLPLLSILILIIRSALPAEVLAVAVAVVAPAPSPTFSSDMAVTQAQALMKIKDAITHDPSSCLSTWTTTSTSSTSASDTDVVPTTTPPSYCPYNGTAGWFGLLCDDSFHITSLNLSNCNLSGSISPSLALLPSLSLLDLSYNNFSGPLSPSLFIQQPLNSSSSLTYLDLSYNALLSGDIPTSLILNSPNLQTLRLSYTGLSGVVPPEMWTHLPARLELSISDTWSDSSPPLLSILPTSFPSSANFSFCATIQVFVLSGLDASGASFPSSLGDCQQLQILFLVVTGLQGSIPPSIWQLPHLQTLVIEDRNVINTVDNSPKEPRPYKLHGPLPSTFGFCSAAGSTIEDMYIDGINLTGQIPVSIGTCASLQHLGLSYTSLEGSIPHSLGNLTHLQTLYLQGNKLTGKIPTTLGSCSQLIELQLGFNALMGSIPSELGMLIKLQVLSLFAANLEGPVPLELCNCTQMVWFDVGWMPKSVFFNYLPPGYPLSQGLTGSIPECFGRMANLHTLVWQLSHIEGGFPTKVLQNLTQLQYLDLSYCSMVDTFPAELNWNFPHLKHLNLQYNQLKGSIPPQVGQLPNLEQLNFGSNRLNGTIPEQLLQGLAQYSTLTTLNLGGNALEGFISSSFCGIASLQALLLGPNSFNGSIPACLGSLENLTELDLGHNSLQGIVPVDALNNLTALQTLRLFQNNFIGKIESLNLSKLWNLKTFSVYGNAFEGGLPAGLTESEALVVFDVQWNKYLTGSLGNTTTTDITGLSKLRVLSVSYNQLIGDIPGWVWKLPSLQALDLSNNRFSDRFPASLTHLSYFKLNQTANSNQTTLYEYVPVTLKNTFYTLSYVLSTRIYFDVSMNNLEGKIPESFGELQGLTGANLSHNRISGTIPAATFGRLMKLDVLDLSYNQLSGGIPQDLTSLNLGNLNLTHNQLEGPIPTRNNFNTRYSSASFENNPGLCGYPLSSSCNTSNNGSSDIGTTARQTQKAIVIWFNEFVSPWAFLIAYPVGLILGFFVCRTIYL